MKYISARRTPVYLFFFIPAVTILTSWITSEIILKPLFAHTRPQGALSYGYSFPSTHSTVAFALAVVFSMIKPRYKSVSWGIAAGVSWSRVYAGEHHIQDVVAGALLGILMGFLVAKTLLQRQFARAQRLQTTSSKRRR